MAQHGSAFALGARGRWFKSSHPDRREERMKVCSVEECKGEVFAVGLCRKHYNKQRKYGNPLAGKNNGVNKGKKCSIFGCEKEAHVKGYCQYHYDVERWKNEEFREKRRFFSRKYKRSEKGQATTKLQKESGRTKEIVKKYHNTEKGREVLRRARSARRARKLGVALESFAHKEIFERDNWVCGICGKSVDKYLEYPDPLSPSLDHIIPLSKGGSHTKNNVQLAHLCCNLQKGARNVQHLSPQV